MPPAVAESGEEEAAEPIHTQDKATGMVGGARGKEEGEGVGGEGVGGICLNLM